MTENTSSVRTCTRCGQKVVEPQECPTCLAVYDSLRDPAEMTTAERLAEFNSWFRAKLPEISNNLVYLRVVELVGHPVDPIDVATAMGREALRREIVAS